MTQVLLLLSSPRGNASLSTKVARVLAERLVSEKGAHLKVRNLDIDGSPHIDSAYTVGRFVPPEQRTPEQAKAAAYAETLVDELMAADVLIIAASMINFAPSSTLKAWIDHVVWPGKTMMQTHDGPVGLIKGKKVYLVAASGGIYSSGPMMANDMLVPYLKQILGFIGITDIETIRIEAQSLGREQAEKSFDTAMTHAKTMGLAEHSAAAG
jgi:FMN-dependent NADH-azoreductase